MNINLKIFVTQPRGGKMIIEDINGKKQTATGRQKKIEGQLDHLNWNAIK